MWLYLKEVNRWEQGLLNGPWLNPFRKKVKSLSHVWLFATPWTVAYHAPPSTEFSRQEYWSGLPFLSPGDLPDPGIEPGSPTLQPDTLPSEPPGKSIKSFRHPYKRRCGLSWGGHGGGKDHVRMQQEDMAPDKPPKEASRPALPTPWPRLQPPDSEE